MNPFPNKNSVLVLDNAKIHHDQELLDYLDAFGVKVKFLPPYSPDLNPIETAFSTIKQFLQRNRYFVEISYNPIYPLLIAYFQITPQMAKGYFKGYGYF
ncbi:IS630 family transposase [Rhizophagus irregularis DAOM 181602=DAOM 197198]|nr:IS630 family transposase [Rhizophagus irregularis DAOM 181602=DAOM 197198]